MTEEILNEVKCLKLITNFINKYSITFVCFFFKKMLHLMNDCKGSSISVSQNVFTDVSKHICKNTEAHTDNNNKSHLQQVRTNEKKFQVEQFVIQKILLKVRHMSICKCSMFWFLYMGNGLKYAGTPESQQLKLKLQPTY